MLLDLFFLIWCFPQNTLAHMELLSQEKQENVIEIFQYKDADVVVLEADDFFAYTYGDTIFLSEAYLSDRTEVTLAHEYGHVIQSRRQGPLHALLVGLPSGYHQYRSPFDREWADRYYERWPEASADRLGGASVIRRSAAWRRPPWYENHPETVHLQEYLYPKHSLHLFTSFYPETFTGGGTISYSGEYIFKSTSEFPLRAGISLSYTKKPFKNVPFCASCELVNYAAKKASGLFGTAGVSYNHGTGAGKSSSPADWTRFSPTASAGVRFHPGILNIGLRSRFVWKNFRWDPAHQYNQDNQENQENPGSSFFRRLEALPFSVSCELGISL